LKGRKVIEEAKKNDMRESSKRDPKQEGKTEGNESRGAKGRVEKNWT